VDENPPHQPRRHCEEVRAVLPLNPLHFNKPQICLVDECGRLQRVTAPLMEQVTRGKAAQLVVDERQQRVERVRFTPVPGQEQRRRVRTWLGNALILSPLEGWWPFSRLFSASCTVSGPVPAYLDRRKAQMPNRTQTVIRGITL